MSNGNATGRWDFEIPQGTTYNVVLSLLDDNDNPMNLSTFKARMQIREVKDSTTKLLDVTSDDDELSVDEGAGTITVSIDSETTAALSFEEAVYDLEIYDGNDPPTVYRVLEGFVILSKEVTR